MIYNPIRRRRYLVTVFALLAILIVTTPGAVHAGGQREDAAPPRPRTDARVEYLEGTVTIDGTVAAIGDRVSAGSVVRTGTDGTADIVFGSGNALRIRENTEVTLDLGNPAVGIDIRRGTFAAVFHGLESIGTGPGDTFRVRTPATIAGVRGTAFFVHIEEADSTYVCTCNGELFFEESNLTIRAARHDATRFIRRDGATVAEDAAELYHDTESLNAVADIVGVTIAWGEEP